MLEAAGAHTRRPGPKRAAHRIHKLRDLRQQEQEEPAPLRHKVVLRRAHTLHVAHLGQLAQQERHGAERRQAAEHCQEQVPGNQRTTQLQWLAILHERLQAKHGGHVGRGDGSNQRRVVRVQPGCVTRPVERLVDEGVVVIHGSCVQVMWGRGGVEACLSGRGCEAGREGGSEWLAQRAHMTKNSFFAAKFVRWAAAQRPLGSFLENLDTGRSLRVFVEVCVP